MATISYKHNLKNRLFRCFHWRTIVAIAGISALIAVLLTGLSAGSRTGTLLLDFAVNHLFAFAISMSIFFFVELSGASTIPSGLKKGMLLTVAFVLGGMLGTLIAVGILKVIWQDQAVIDNFSELLLMNIFLAIFFGVVVTSYFVLRDKFHETAAKLATKEINEQRLLRLKTKAELEALRAKVNPHFLFNTLNSIASLIPVDPAKAEEMVQKLAHIFRYTLDATNREFMKLSKELETVQEYLDIEKIRLGERLTYGIEVESIIADTPIPGLLLQPLVENSVKHGIAGKQEGGAITIKCSQDNGYCRIEIRDTGAGFSQSEMSNGFGLAGVKERLALVYGENYLFDMNAEDGFRVSIQIPL